MHIYDKLQRLCHLNNISVTKLESELHLGQGTLNKWKNSKNPGVITVSKVSDFFNLTIDEFLNDDVLIEERCLDSKEGIG